MEVINNEIKTFNIALLSLYSLNQNFIFANNKSKKKIINFLNDHILCFKFQGILITLFKRCLKQIVALGGG